MKNPRLSPFFRPCLVLIVALMASAGIPRTAVAGFRQAVGAAPPLSISSLAAEPGSGEEPQALPPECEWGKVVVAKSATIVRAQPSLEPGPLFATSGAFAEKPVDMACDPGTELGPVPVDAGGSLVARLTGNPPAPNQWSLHNYGTALSIVFEPLLGEGNYGPRQEVLVFTIPQEETEAEMGGSWPGPGRLRASIGAPWGTGPLTSSCFEQAYTAAVDIVEVFDSSPAQPGMTLHNGDSITTENVWGEVLIAGSTDWIAPGSDVGFDLFAPQSPVREGTFDPVTGRQPDSWSETKPAAAETPRGLDDAFVDAIIRFLERAKDQKTATRIKELRADGKLVFGDLPGGTGEWDRDAGVLTIRKDILGHLTGDEGRDFDQIIDAAQSIRHELVHAEQGKLAWNTSVYSNYIGQGHFYEEDAWYTALDAVAEWWGNVENDWNHSAPLCDQLRNAREMKQLLDLWLAYHNEFEGLSLERRQALATQYDELGVKRSMARNALNGTDYSIRELKQELSRTTDPVRHDELTADLTILELEIRPKEKTELNVVEAEYTRLEALFALDGGGYWFQMRNRAPVEAAIASRLAEVKLILDQATEAGCQEAPQPYAQAPTARCKVGSVEKTVNKGGLHVIEQTPGPGADAVAHVVNVNLNKINYRIQPDGTEYSVEKQDETAIVRVYDGQVTITAAAGPALIVAAGQQVSLPDGEIASLMPEPVRQVAGIPLAGLRLDSDLPAPYGVAEMHAEDATLPPDWVWQEPNKDQNGPGDATLEVLDAQTLRITAPNENEFWGYRADAPRLLHKVTGDFDLEAEMFLQSQGTHFAISEFLIFTPDTPLGYLRGQMNFGGLGANYLIMGGGWSHWENENQLGVINRERADSADAPDRPVRFKLSRRGDQLKTFWSTDDGKAWTLSNRQVLAMPETFWAGWVFKRMAFDGLNDEPSVTTLRDIRLTTAPLGSLAEADWDVVGFEGTVIPLGTELVLAQDGSEGGYVQAYSPWSIAGDFDLTVRYDALPMQIQPDQARYIHVAVTSNDGTHHAYVRNALTPDSFRYDADMSINSAWHRYHYEDTEESSGRLRLARKDGLFAGYIWQADDWAPLADWQDGFTDPVYLDFRFQWQNATPLTQTVRFTVERLETEQGLWEDPGANPASSGLESGEITAAAPFPPSAGSKPALTGKQRLAADNLFDDFSSRALGWSVRDNDSAATGYESGSYAILVKQPTFWVLSKAPGDFPQEVIEFDAAVTQGSTGGMYGVICHYRDPQNYDFVAIDPETGSILAARLVANDYQFLSGAAASGGATAQVATSLASSATASNHIRVGCYDNRLELAVADTTEGSWPLDPPGKPGSAALYAYGFGSLGEKGYKTLFDNVAAWHTPAETETAETPPAVPPPATPGASTRDKPLPACAQAVDPQIAPQWDRAALGCPTGPAQTTWAAIQAFEHGVMIWRQDLWRIYAFYDGGGWATWPDVWSEGLEIASRGQPPAGLLAPVRGFGFVWGMEDEVFRNLGWPRWEESGMCAVVQSFDHGLVIRRSDVAVCDGQTSPGASGWFGGVEAYENGGWR